MIASENIENKPGEEDLNNIAPSLTKIKKENGFMLPENYFDLLPSVIQEKCARTIKQKPLYHSFFKSKHIVKYAFAASIILFGIFFLTRNNPHDAVSNKTLSNNDSNIYINYEPYFDEETDESELTEAIANNSEIEIQPITNIGNGQLSTDDIINYLADEYEDDYENEL